MPKHDNTPVIHTLVTDGPKIRIHQSPEAITVEGPTFAVMVSINHLCLDEQLEFDRIF